MIHNLWIKHNGYSLLLLIICLGHLSRIICPIVRSHEVSWGRARSVSRTKNPRLSLMNIENFWNICLIQIIRPKSNSEVRNRLSQFICENRINIFSGISNSSVCLFMSLSRTENKINNFKYLYRRVKGHSDRLRLIKVHDCSVIRFSRLSFSTHLTRQIKISCLQLKIIRHSATKKISSNRSMVHGKFM